ncbi:thylakoid membrane photosystem I accumulation factor [Lusitaniella coriacea]|uniref:thylakoid membrane photosystem I accumulation factor n=1 Tax=Lusitaniella coriacea TaxID=1983105 RepID=UPI003CFB912C
MTLLQSRVSPIATIQHLLKRLLLVAIIGFLCFFWATPPASAGLNDDRFDGNIYVIYAGNGSLVPSKSTLADSLKRERPAILVFYADDSRDSKQYALIVSRFQEFYGRAATIIPVAIDSIALDTEYPPTEPARYYKGLIPQTVVIDQKGKVVFDEVGQVPFEQVDDVLREVFDLLPRSESVELKRRSFNEFNAELSE